MDSLTIKMPRQLSARVARPAQKRHISRSALVREALESIAEGDAGETFSDRVAHHLGSGDDVPADVLSNPKYMKDYGRRVRECR